MSAIVLRLASPMQSWPTYTASYRQTTTSYVPTKSGIAGLLGACLGIADYATLFPRFDLSARADHVNPFETDLQVASRVKEREQDSALRAMRIAHAKAHWGGKSWGFDAFSDSPKKADRDFLPHSEFMVAVTVDDSIVEQWLSALKRPVFMPYLGRQSNAPEFPFLLGASDSPSDVVLRDIPVSNRDAVDRDGESVTVRLYSIEGDRIQHLVSGENITVPLTTRDSQLGWAKENLYR